MMKASFTFLLLLCTVGTLLWAQPPNDECSGAINLPLGSPSSCPAANPATSTYTYNNNGATPTTPYPALNCGPANGGGMNAPAAEVWFTFTATSNITNITVTSNELSTVNYAVYQGANCTFATGLACSRGSNTITIPTSAGSTYYLLVSGADPDDQGSFTITLQAARECSPCLNQSFLVASPPPANGTYSTGQTVSFCFTVAAWDVTQTNNWLHSVQIQFGGGWDINTLDPFPPPSCDPAGYWAWYDSWTGVNTGITAGPGFAFDSSNGGPLDGNPGNNWGDPCQDVGGFPITFCWDITVQDDPLDCSFLNGADLSLQITTFADGETGSWTSFGCNSDASTSFLASAVCCDQATFLPEIVIPASCDNVCNGQATVEALGGPWNVTVFGPTGNIVEEQLGVFGPLTISDLCVGNYSYAFIDPFSGCGGSDNFTVTPGPPPVALPTANNVCPGEPLQLYGDVIGFGTDIIYQWSGTNFSSNQQNPSVGLPGTYTLVVTVDGCPSDPAQVNIGYIQTNTGAQANPAAVCSGDMINLSASGGASYDWGPYGQGASIQVMAPAVLSSQIIPYTVNIQTANGCLVTETVEVTVNPLPEADIQAPVEACLGQPITVSASGGVQYEWSDTQNGPVIAITPNSLPLEELSVTVTSQFGCQDMATTFINVNPPPVATATADPETVCPGGVATLTATGGVNYEWSNTLVGQSIMVSPTTSGVYEVTVTDGNDCRATAQVAVGVEPALAAPVVQCGAITPNSVEFTWNDVPGATGYNVTVATNQTGVQGGNTFTVVNLSPAEEVTITVQATGPNGCPNPATTLSCFSQDCLPVGVEATPVAPICLDGDSGPDTLSVTIAGAMADGDTLWSGTGITDPLLGIFDPAQADIGTHQIIVAYTEGDCTFRDTLQIEVLPVPTATFVPDTNYLCVADTAILTYTGTADTTATYTWDFDGGVAAPDTGQGPLLVTWANGGIKVIGLAVTQEGCLSELYTDTLEIQEPLPAPVVSCGTTSTTSVSFTWADVPGATGYLVEVLSGQSGVQNGNSFQVDMLMPEEVVIVRVTALNDGPCGDSSTEFSCAALACPNFQISINNINSSNSLCLNAATTPLNLSAVVTGGDGSGTGTWNGPGVTDVVNGAFDPVVAGAGLHTITYTYTEGPCTGSATLDITVNETPTANFTVGDAEACINQAVAITYTGDADPNSATFTWGFNGGTAMPGTGAGPHTVSWATAGDKSITLLVEENGCSSEQFIQTVAVSSPMPPPVVNCNPTTSSVEFSWNDVPGATAYTVNLIAGPAGVQAGNTYLVTGLSPGDQVEIEVAAVGDGPCGNSTAMAACIAEDCPIVTIDINAIAPICLDASAVPINLTATISGGAGGGTESWSGPGITDATAGLFDPNLAGPGTHTLSLVYQEGNCSYNNSIDIVVNEQPTATFSATAAICVDESSTAVYTGNAGPGAIYTWDFGGGLAAPGTGVGPHAVNWAAGGTQMVSLTVVENGCASELFSQMVEVEEPLAAPVLNCNTTTSSISFSWMDVPGATGYNVSVLSGPTGIQSGNSYLVENLTPGDVVRIRVEAAGTGPCGSSFAELECTAEDCPDVMIDIASPGPFCEGDIFVEIPLQATLTGAAGGGVENWSGPGIIDPANGIFDPAAANIGTNTITYTYTEGNCVYNASLDIVIHTRPSADFTVDASICQTETSTLAYTGPAAAGATFNWDFDGGTAVPGTGEGPHEVSWANGGIHPVTLIVTENGCDSEPVTQEVQVAVPLENPVIACNTDNTSITFSWADVPGATGYQVVDVTGPAGMLSGNTYTVTGLSPGTEVTIQVIAESGTACGNSIAEESCIALDCPDVLLEIPAMGPFCEGDEPVTLSATVTGGDGAGAFQWSGNGVQGDIFNPASAPQPGDYTISVQYTEGVCEYTASSIITVNPVPTATFTANSPVCEQSASLVTYTGTASPGANYTWDFDGGTAVPGTGAGPHQVAWNDAGTKAISLIVSENGCTSEAAGQEVVVEAPLVAPVITCQSTSTSVTFLWNPVPGAADYQVEVLQGPAGTLNGTTYTFTGLTPGEAVQIQVAAIGSGPCGNSSAELSCIAQDCLPLSAAISGPEAICNGSGAVLTVSINTAATGPFLFTYTVNGENETAISLPAGESTLEVDINETTTFDIVSIVDSNLPDCIYQSSSTWTVEVQEPNQAGMAGEAARLCAQTDSTILLTDLIIGLQPGGQWREVSAAPSSGGAFNPGAATFVVDGQPAGAYTFAYAVSTSTACPADEVQVSVEIENLPVADAGADQELTCNMGMITLGSNNTSAGVSYLWSSPDSVLIPDPNSQFIDVGQPGAYLLTVTNAAGCTASDEVAVTANLEVPTFEAVVSEISCFAADDGVISLSNISGGQPPYRISFDGGAFLDQAQFTNLGAADYSIVVQDQNGCISELSVNLEQPREVVVTLTTNIDGENVIQLGDSVRLTAVYDPNIPIDTIRWEPDSIGFGNSNSVWVSPLVTASFSVTIQDTSGCADTDRMSIIVDKDRPVYIPNAFSPNEDGRNDVFFIQSGKGVKAIQSFLIFNRWGETIFELYDFQPNDPSLGWDGTFRGERMNTGVFAYFVEVEFEDGEVILFEGDVILMK
ncbi:MAG: gliding motility-associated C-terminal domain-containing protein [Phaeodactylibacter sp.]|nr:gliding motility-associated C-terminal domain-containing protein [Phaeodactylibacter sp.]